MSDLHNNVGYYGEAPGYVKPTPTPQETGEAASLVAKGYRRVSWKHRIIARVDRADFVEVMARDQNRAPADFMQPGSRDCAPNWCDHYRRCYSKDTLTVNPAVLSLIPSSYDGCGFVKLCLLCASPTVNFACDKCAKEKLSQ
jgi:hypothetical protein